MGRVYSVHRYSLDIAVDLLSLRRRVQDVDHPTFYAPLQRYRDPPADVPPRTIDFISAMNNTDLAMMVGPKCEGLTGGNMWKWHSTHEADDPRLWTTRGARLVGWHEYVPTREGAGDFPLRYSIPQDVDAILETLQELSTEELQANMEQSFDAGLVETEFYRVKRDEIPLRDLVEEVVPNLLQTLRMFYTAAQEENEIAVYVLR